MQTPAAENGCEHGEMPHLTRRANCLGRSRPKRDELQAAVAQPTAGEFSATLLAMAGHELRPPLQVLTSALEVLGGLPRDTGQRAELARLEAAAKKLAAILGQLVEAVQLEASRHCPRTSISVALIVDELAEKFSEPARDRGIIVSRHSIGGTGLTHPVLLSGMADLLGRRVDVRSREVFGTCFTIVIASRRELPSRQHLGGALADSSHHAR